MKAIVKASNGNRDVDGEADATRQYLTFMLGGEVYALAILNIKEIIEYGKLTAVPMMPSFIRGVINLRGAVVPVVDLASRFGGPPVGVTRRTCIVILELESAEGRQVIGVIVDAVNEVIEIAGSYIEPPPSFGARIRSDFISGMARRDDAFVVLLDPARVLSVDELAQLERTAQVESGD